MNEESIHFSKIKEGRNSYFVEYLPPYTGSPIAILQLSFPGEYRLSEVSIAMESEALLWARRFPVPLMVTAFNNLDDPIELDGVRESRDLICFVRQDADNPELHWGLVDEGVIPKDALNKEYLLQVYEGVQHKTSSELRALAIRKAKEMRIGWYVIFAWVVILPAVVLVLEFIAPTWIAVLVLLYGLSKALSKALKMMGKIKPSAAEQAKNEEEQRMRHHHYHCERNPEGFLRLKLDNFEKDTREENERKAASLGVKIKSAIGARENEVSRSRD